MTHILGDDTGIIIIFSGADNFSIRTSRRVMNTVFITLKDDEYGIHHPQERRIFLEVMMLD